MAPSTDRDDPTPRHAVAACRDVRREGGAHGRRRSVPAEAVAILQNTAEQVVAAVPTHRAFAAIVGNPTRMPMTPAALFWAGYGRGAAGRALGFGLAFDPTLAAPAIAAARVPPGRAA